MKTLPIFAGLLAVLALSACTTVPPTRVAQPMTVRPPEASSMPAMSGSIYQAGLSRPLFEDRRARYVGDILTINIVENNTASSKANASSSRATAITANVPSPLPGVPRRMFDGMNFSADNSNTMTGKGAADNTNVFKGTITVTVTEVLPNGNLMVSGEKLVSIGPGDEYVRLSGVINPNNISGTNMVDSSKVADARIEYKSAGYISESMQMPWLARFFLNVLPF